MTPVQCIVLARKTRFCVLFEVVILSVATGIVFILHVHFLELGLPAYIAIMSMLMDKAHYDRC